MNAANLAVVAMVVATVVCVLGIGYAALYVLDKTAGRDGA
jgi:hypothetical protein